MVCIRQINCHKSIASTEQVPQYRASDIVLLQEPNTSTIGTLKQKGKVICASGLRRLIRSVIYVSNRAIDVTSLQQFTTPDMATAQIEGQSTIVCSLYLDIKLPVWPSHLQDLILFCTNKNKKLIIGIDCNAHSAMWGCSDSNARGDQLEERIIQNNLFVHNVGSTPTFSSHLGESIIDITLSNSPPVISGWKVSRVPSLSDHRIVEFRANHVKPGPEPLIRNMKKVSWQAVAEDLRSAVPPCLPTWWSVQDLEGMCKDFTNSLRNSIDRQAPLQKPGKRHTVWWNPQCTEARKLCLKLAKKAEKARRARANNSRFLRDQAAAAQKRYQKIIMKAKRDSWREFVSSIDNTADASKLNKIMKALGCPNVELGLVKDDDGHLADDKQASIELMLEEHFPDSTPSPVDVEGDRYIFPKALPSRSWLTRHRFRNAVAAFKPGKKEGPDLVRAEFLKSLDNTTIDFILKLFNASVTLGHVPRPWREVDCIFLPKVGKPDYQERRAYRPISLMSVLFKTLERLVLWRLEETALVINPLHKNQFGGLSGLSTENALSKVVNTIDKGIGQGHYVCGVFLDIKGAFDNLKYASIIKEFKSRGVENEIIDWYQHFLEHRCVTAKHGSASACVQPENGTPQGGILSCKCSWNCPFDNLLKLFDNTPVDSSAFVDDKSLLITGVDPTSMYEMMQRYLNYAQAWATKNGLTFCPNKSVTILFSHRELPKTLKKPPLLYLNGKALPNVSSTKLLGITLDKKLTFQTHIKQRIKACKIALMRIRPLLRKAWSPSPRQCRWLIEGVIYPMLTYGSLVWAKATERPFIIKELAKLQRLALLSIANVRYSTPTAALELIYNIPPLHLQIREKARMSFLRLGDARHTQWTTTYPDRMERYGHLEYIRRSLPLMEEDDDVIPPTPNWDRKYTITTARNNPPTRSGTAAYTDGSLLAGRSGAGAYLEVENAQILCLSERLNKCTVFQSELRAICMTCELLLDLNMTDKPVAFHVDSESALKALDASVIKSRTVEQTRDILTELGSCTPVSLQWVKAHVPKKSPLYCPGNEQADVAARKGSASNRIQCFDMAAPRTDMRNHIRALRDSEWKKEWQARTDCRQTKLFIDGPEPKIWADIKALRHKEVSATVRFLTGHTYLNRHNVVIKYKVRGQAADTHEEATCRLCEEDEETPAHLVTTCPALSQERFSLLCSPELDTPPSWSRPLLDFLNLPQIRQLEVSDLETAGGF